MQKWTLSGNGQQLTAEFEVGLFASRDIEAGEELCYDYGKYRKNRSTLPKAFKSHDFLCAWQVGQCSLVAPWTAK